MIDLSNPTTGGLGSVLAGQNATGVSSPPADIYAPGQTPVSESAALTKIIKGLSDQFPEVTFTVVTLNFTTAMNQQEFDFQGTCFRVQFVNNGSATFQVQFNNITNGLIDMAVGNEISGSYFKKFFITASAQSGFIARILIWTDTPSVRLSMR